MALTSTTTLDLAGQTQTLTYFNPSQIEQITFSNNSITFGATAGYNLEKSDILLFFKFLNIFNNLLLVNFPQTASSIGGTWPLGIFEITETNIGVQKIIYTQSSQGTSILGINYVPISGAGSISARPSPVTITLQEFFSSIVFLAQYNSQVTLN